MRKFTHHKIPEPHKRIATATQARIFIQTMRNPIIHRPTAPVAGTAPPRTPAINESSHCFAFFLRAFLICVVITILSSCNSDIKTHQLFYGSTPPLAASITVGDVIEVTSVSKQGLPSPSMISPNKLAIIKMVDVLKGQGVGGRIGLAFEAGRSSEPTIKQRYVFFWDQTGKCIQYFTVKEGNYIKDGRELPLAELMLQ